MLQIAMIEQGDRRETYVLKNIEIKKQIDCLSSKGPSPFSLVNITIQLFSW